MLKPLDVQLSAPVTPVAAGGTVSPRTMLTVKSAGIPFKVGGVESIILIKTSIDAAFPQSSAAFQAQCSKYKKPSR